MDPAVGEVLGRLWGVGIDAMSRHSRACSGELGLRFMTAPGWLAAPAGAVTFVALICLSAGEATRWPRRQLCRSSRA